MIIPFPFLKNSKGEPDGMWTLTALSFLAAQSAVFLWPSASTAALTLFSACAAAYYGRKHTDSRAPLPLSKAAPAPPDQKPRRTAMISEGHPLDGEDLTG